MRKEYDFSQAVKKPYVKPVKIPVTIRLDRETVDYFKALSEDANLPLSNLDQRLSKPIAQRKNQKLVLTWESMQIHRATTTHCYPCK